MQNTGSVIIFRHCNNNWWWWWIWKWNINRRFRSINLKIWKWVQ